MFTAADHEALHREFLKLAGEIRVVAHRSGLDDELAGISLSLLEIANIHLQVSVELQRKGKIMRLRMLLMGLLIVAALLVSALVVTAQDVTAEPTAIATEVPAEPPTPALPPTTESPEDILGVVLAALFGGAATIGGSFIVTSIVGVLKMIIPASVVSGDTLKNVTALVVWLGYSLAIQFGLGTQFQNVAAILAPILTSAIPLIGVLIGSAKLYLASKEHKVPILGYQRPGPSTTYVRQ